MASTSLKKYGRGGGHKVRGFGHTSPINEHRKRRLDRNFKGPDRYLGERALADLVEVGLKKGGRDIH